MQPRKHKITITPTPDNPKTEAGGLKFWIGYPRTDQHEPRAFLITKHWLPSGDLQVLVHCSGEVFRGPFASVWPALNQHVDRMARDLGAFVTGDRSQCAQHLAPYQTQAWAGESRALIFEQPFLASRFAPAPLCCPDCGGDGGPMARIKRVRHEAGCPKSIVPADFPHTNYDNGAWTREFRAAIDLFDAMKAAEPARSAA